MPPPEQNDLEQLAARIADEQPVDWRELDADTASVSGLREIDSTKVGELVSSHIIARPHEELLEAFLGNGVAKK